MIKQFTYTAMLALLSCAVAAQDKHTDTTLFVGDAHLTVADTAFYDKVYDVDTLMDKPIPAKATMMSAVVPGLGQLYNSIHYAKQGKFLYWKIPIAWGLIGGSTYFLVRYQNQFQRYRRAYIDFKDGDPFTNSHEKLKIPSSYDTEKFLSTYKDTYRKYRDYAIIAVVITYLMNVVDANVDAHLFDYNMSDDLALHAAPHFFQDDLISPKIGVTLCLSFKCK